MAVLDAILPVPFAIGSQRFACVETVHGRFMNDMLFYIDGPTIGSRYTECGFNGETMLAAQRASTGAMNSSIRLGQRARCPMQASTAYLAGTQLAGTAIGLRGSVSMRLGGLRLARLSITQE
ncbi:hypothetical protein PUN4_1400003 [Paraburkholderia unamae]|nr:hypothetical protein PUN4_1400003 [Paraburkholderia unamae]